MIHGILSFHNEAIHELFGATLRTLSSDKLELLSVDSVTEHDVTNHFHCPHAA